MTVLPGTIVSDLNLLMLGTGGAFTRYEDNYHNNALVETSKGWVMIDCGGTAVQSMAELGIKPWEVKAVFVTHIHGDHVNGIEQLAYERFYTGVRGPGWLKTLLVTTWDVFPGLRDVLEPGVRELTTPNGASGNGFDVLFDVMAGEFDELVVGDVVFKFHRTPHIVGPGVDKPSYGVSVQKGNAHLYYTSDSTFRPSIGDLPFAKNLVLHDCTMSPIFPATVHTHYDELRTLPANVRERTLLMHHGKVPAGIDVVKDGFMGALRRHEQVTVSQNGVVCTHLRPPRG